MARRQAPKYASIVLQIAGLLRQNDQQRCDVIAKAVDRLGAEYAMALARQSIQHSERPMDRYNLFVQKTTQASQPPHRNPKLSSASVSEGDSDLDHLMRRPPRR